EPRTCQADEGETPHRAARSAPTDWRNAATPGLRALRRHALWTRPRWISWARWYSGRLRRSCLKLLIETLIRVAIRRNRHEGAVSVRYSRVTRPSGDHS